MQVKAWAVLIVAVLWTAVIAVSAPPLARLWELRESGATTSGVITGVDHRDHDRARYSYRVKGTEYTGSEVASFHTKGETVWVYYSPRRPWISTLAEPERTFREDLIGTVLLCLLIVAVVMAVALRAR